MCHAICTKEIAQKQKRTFYCQKCTCEIPHFYIIWKILKNPIVGRPIVAGYNWILTPASIFVGHYLKEFYSKSENILTDSLSVVKMLESRIFDRIFFLFTIDFKSLYINISVKDAIKLMNMLFSSIKT